MPSYAYEVAKTVLNENDKDRIVCIYLSSDPAATNWAKASNDFGSASVESFKKTTQNMLKKIEKAGGKIDDDGNAAIPPKTAAPKATPTKRKTKADDADDAETKPKKRGRKSKAEIAAEEAAADDDKESSVKREVSDEDDL